MQTLRPGFDVAGFFAAVARAPRRLLLLDYDGTLAPFHVDPARAVPYPGIVPALDALMAAEHTRVVIVSGRRAQDLLPLLPLRQQPEIWGSHGWERLMPDGEYHAAWLPEAALKALVEADDRAEALEALGARTERKPASLAIHWRGLPSERIADIRGRVGQLMSDLGRPATLVEQEFDGGIELRAGGHDKGDAVRALLQECDGPTALAYLGDDDTDEDAFRAVPEDGAAVLVASEPRSTAAALWLRPPEELIGFLRDWDRAAPGS
jgi:trehalose-phosphatase